MYNHFQLASKYLRYFFSASNGKGHGTHSPFIFQFITQVLNDRSDYPVYAPIESLRTALQKDQTVLEIKDHGAGSSVTKNNQRKIGSIANNTVKPKKWGQLLFRITQMYKPAIMMELGTSLGLTSAYLASGNAKGKLYTLEGADSVACLAKKNLGDLNVTNTQVITGNFDITLPPLLKELDKVDMVFLDGNHREEPTIQYFNWLLPHCGNDTLLIFDDIHWSQEMESAWKTIREHHSVRCTIDLFFIGIVLFREEFKEKQDFTIRF